MSNRIYFSIPYENILQNEEGWQRDPLASFRFSVIRCHFMLIERQVADANPIKMGEIIDTITSEPGITEKRTKTLEYERATVLAEETFQQSLIEDETMVEFGSTLSAGLDSGLGKISSELSAKAQNKLRESFTNSFKIKSANTLKQNETKTREFSIDPEKFAPDATVVFFIPYKKHAYDLFLLYFDYLIVEYKGYYLSTVYKRRKLPEVVLNKHQNIVKCNIPLASFHFWKPVGEPAMENQKNYALEVEDPFDFQIMPLTNLKVPFGVIKPNPTLYELAERAFEPKRYWTV